MRRLCYLLIVALFGCGGGGGQAGNPLIGQIAPDFSLTDVSQNTQEFTSQDLCVIAKQTFDATIQNDVHLGRVSWCAKK